MFRNRRQRGICLISLGAGILLALVLPVGCIIVVCSLTMIILGISWMRGR
ncbi:MAG: hypothetical protein LUD79_00245 [Oscillospiraceae bacterium]|nr:hypothetical protein [Oscillospiraceae bacterium]